MWECFKAAAQGQVLHGIAFSSKDLVPLQHPHQLALEQIEPDTGPTETELQAKGYSPAKMILAPSVLTTGHPNNRATKPVKSRHFSFQHHPSTPHSVLEPFSVHALLPAAKPQLHLSSTEQIISLII